MLDVISVDIFPEIFSECIESVRSKPMLPFFGSNYSLWWPLSRYMLHHLQHVPQHTTTNKWAYHFLCAGDFMKEGETYEDIVEFKTLKTFMEERLEDYNMEPGVIGMDLVLFRDAIEHGMDKFCCFLRISQFLDLGIVLPASLLYRYYHSENNLHVFIFQLPELFVWSANRVATCFWWGSVEAVARV